MLEELTRQGQVQQAVSICAMVAFHVKLFRCPAPADEAIWAFCMLIMSLRAGNASVALHFTAHEHC